MHDDIFHWHDRQIVLLLAHSSFYNSVGLIEFSKRGMEIDAGKLIPAHSGLQDLCAD